jgi:hypothetical protein
MRHGWGCRPYSTLLRHMGGGGLILGHLLAIQRTTQNISALRPSVMSVNQIRWPPNFVYMSCPPTYDAHKNIRWSKMRWSALTHKCAVGQREIGFGGDETSVTQQMSYPKKAIPTGPTGPPEAPRGGAARGDATRAFCFTCSASLGALL